MSRQSDQRRSRTTSSAHGFDCVSFMALASPHRWREIEAWFPQDDQAAWEMEQAIRALPKQDDSIHIFGSCAMRPDEIVIANEDTQARINRLKCAPENNPDAYIDHLLLSIAKQEEAKRKAAEEALRKKKEADRKLPDMKKMVPLDGDLVNPGPDYVKEVKVERKKQHTIAELQELDRVAALERKTKEEHEARLKRRMALVLAENWAILAETRRLEKLRKAEEEAKQAVKCCKCAVVITDGLYWENTYICYPCYHEAVAKSVEASKAEAEEQRKIEEQRIRTLLETTDYMEESLRLARIKLAKP